MGYADDYAGSGMGHKCTGAGCTHPSHKGHPTGRGGRSMAHPGFQAVQAKIAKKSGVPMKNAGAILAAASRNASAKAKKANPRLRRV